MKKQSQSFDGSTVLTAGFTQDRFALYCGGRIVKVFAIRVEIGYIFGPLLSICR